MKYTFSRAVTFGIIGFCVGALLTVLIRSLQGLDPIWQPDIALIGGTIFTALFFVWGIGAFDPAMSAHDEEHADAAHSEPSALAVPAARAPAVVDDEPFEFTPAPEKGFVAAATALLARLLEAAQKPVARAIGGWNGRVERHVSWRVAQPTPGSKFFVVMWRLLVLTLVLVLWGAVFTVLGVVWLLPTLLFGLPLLLLRGAVFADATSTVVFRVFVLTAVMFLVMMAVANWPGGFYIRQTNDPVGSRAATGFMTWELFGTDVVVSELALFLIFTLITFLTLGAVGGGLALLFWFLSRGLKESKASKPTPEDTTPPMPLRVGKVVATWLLSMLPPPPAPRGAANAGLKQ